MTDDDATRPACFADLATVFPMGPDGLRESPPRCRRCSHKVACLRAALAGRGGVAVREEILDRSYASGRIGFFQRWSRKKALYRRRQTSPATQSLAERTSS